ncbi:MAG: 4Fe-4S dicluster domain-containing protein [Tepidisphaeraceae bacterium]
MPDDDRPMDRRRFFRRSLSELLKPIAGAIAPIERAAHKIGELESVGRAAPVRPPLGNKYPLNVWLRPPGAIAEKEFIHTCTRGGECVRACPAQCIVIDQSATQGAGVPFINADLSACVVCTGLDCMRACPSGALVPTSINDIDMGTAVWKQETCVRSSGEDCRICVDQCPLGEMAIGVAGDEIAVKPLGCIGCGMCQQYCPTNPKSIVVIPKAAKER